MEADLFNALHVYRHELANASWPDAPGPSRNKPGSRRHHACTDSVLQPLGVWNTGSLGQILLTTFLAATDQRA